MASSGATKRPPAGNATRCRLPTVPAEWRCTKVGTRAIVVRAAELCMSILDASRRIWDDGLGLEGYIGLACVLEVALVVLLLCRLRQRWPRAFEVVECIHGIVAPSVLLMTTINTPNLFVRYRRQILLLALAIIPPIGTCMRAHLYLVVVCVATAINSWATVVINREMPPLTLYLAAVTNASIGVMLFTMCSAQMRTLQEIYEAEVSLQQEKEASDGLLTMLCDATVVFADDGDTVLECDKRFSHIMGAPMLGQRVSGFLEGSEEGMRQFLQMQNVLLGATVGSTPTPVTVLPISVLSKTGELIRLMLYAVGHRRGAHAAKRYTVGVTVQRADAPPAELGFADHLVSDVPGASPASQCGDAFEDCVDPEPRASRRPALGSGTSEAPSTRTGVLFRPFYFMDETTFAEGLDVRACLGQLAELGRKEHWLIEPTELAISRVPLGTGGFGSVHDATFCGAPVVVKLVRDVEHRSLKSVASLVNELRVLRHCRHPNLVDLKGAVIDTELCRIGLVLEALPGGNLKQWMSRWATDAGRFRVMLGVCRALLFLHTRSPSITHGDLKPENVLVARVGRDETAKVVDFGLSRLETFELSGVKGGTLRWIAPEVYRQGLRATLAGDTFAYGRLMENLLTGEAHYEDARKADVVAELLSGRLSPPRWPAVGGPLLQLFRPLTEACLSVSPEERPTMAELHGVMLAVPTRQFDDRSQSAARMVYPGTFHVPWREAVGPNDSSSSSSPSGRRLGLRGEAEGQTVIRTCRAARLCSLLSALGRWEVEVSGASCCSLHAALWQASRDVQELYAARCPAGERWRQPSPGALAEHLGSQGAAGAGVCGCGACLGAVKASL